MLTLNITKHFLLKVIFFNLTLLIILKFTEVTNKAGLDNFSGHFLNDGVNVLANSITDLCNILIKSGKFSEFYEFLSRKLNLHKRCSLTELSRSHLLNSLNL